jgi:hypothetical protein
MLKYLGTAEDRDCSRFVQWPNVGHGHLTPPVSARRSTEPNGSKTAENMRTRSGGSTSTLRLRLLREAGGYPPNVLQPTEAYCPMYQYNDRLTQIFTRYKYTWLWLQCFDPLLGHHQAYIIT